MKDIFKIIKAYLTSCFLLYILFSFFIGKGDIYEWDREDGLTFYLLTVILNIFICIALTEKDDKR